MAEPVTSKEIAARLRELSQLPLKEPADLSAWNEAAWQFEDWLTHVPVEFSDRVPHFVWHYIHDADIRVKDEVYRAHQEEQLVVALAELERSDAV